MSSSERRHLPPYGHLSSELQLPASFSSLPPDGSEPLPCVGIFGLATHRMCGLPGRPGSRWALTPPFHPYLRGGGYFLSHLPNVATRFPLESMMLCVARTFLRPLPAAGDRPHFCIKLFRFLFSLTTRLCQSRSRRAASSRGLPCILCPGR